MQNTRLEDAFREFCVCVCIRRRSNPPPSKLMQMIARERWGWGGGSIQPWNAVNIWWFTWFSTESKWALHGCVFERTRLRIGCNSRIWLVVRVRRRRRPFFFCFIVDISTSVAICFRKKRLHHPRGCLFFLSSFLVLRLWDEKPPSLFSAAAYLNFFFFLVLLVVKVFRVWRDVWVGSVSRRRPGSRDAPFSPPPFFVFLLGFCTLISLSERELFSPFYFRSSRSSLLPIHSIS